MRLLCIIVQRIAASLLLLGTISQGFRNPRQYNLDTRWISQRLHSPPPPPQQQLTKSSIVNTSAQFVYCCSRTTKFRLQQKIKNDSECTSDQNVSIRSVLSETVLHHPNRTIVFSILMTLSGAVLGPFLDSFHSAFGVLQYDLPNSVQLWGSDENHPALITAWWVPWLFGLAGFIIGWMYILFDTIFSNTNYMRLGRDNDKNVPSPPKILVGISIFTFQYWLSGLLYQSNMDRTTILNIMSIAAASGFYLLDRTMVGFIVSSATAVSGPLIEVALLTLSQSSYAIYFLQGAGYHYNDLGETGYFPLWIVPVYFLGGPANGNLARGYWHWLSTIMGMDATKDNLVSFSNDTVIRCPTCKDTRCVSCPNW